ncbi:MAG: peptidoglycan DD-metalloendopeptidase family protein [Tepidibacillus sp.]
MATFNDKFTDFKGKFQKDLTKASNWGKTIVQTVQQYIQSNKKRSIIIGSITGTILMTTLFGVGYYQANAVNLYHVYLDGKEVGVVNNKEVVEQWKEQVLKQAQNTYSTITLNFGNKITYQEEKKFKGQFDNAKTLSALKDAFSIQATAVELVVNGKVVGYVKDQKTADLILEQIKQPFLPNKNKDKVKAASLDGNNQQIRKLDQIQIKEEVVTKEVKVTPAEILSAEDMVTLLKQGTLEQKKYIVKQGDTLSGIAQQFGITTKQIYQLNPNIKGEFINIGDEVIVTAKTPLVTVQTKETVINQERIPYKVVYQKDSSMYSNQTKVVQQGSDGKKSVEYSILKENGVTTQKTILKETVISEAKDKIVKKGTKIVPSRGSGTLLWPTVGGIITSKYGSRWGRTHEGIDISGVSNRTIKAADSGKVVFAGWNGAYGKAIIIDHGNGMKTLYGHLSQIMVSSGDKVAKGQQIGVMGNTGRSTGTHLHFEVLVNGSNRNPLNYVRR